MQVVIEPMGPADWPAVRAIYEEGIATGGATLETSVPDWADWDREHLSACRLVAKADGEIVGWAALSPVSTRAVYRGVAEVSLYVAERARGKGVGKALLRALVDASEREGIWTVQAGMFRDNDASIALCRACGFRTVGVRERLGKVNRVWRDIVLMERRSSRVGT